MFVLPGYKHRERVQFSEVMLLTTYRYLGGDVTQQGHHSHVGPHILALKSLLQVLWHGEDLCTQVNRYEEKSKQKENP